MESQTDYERLGSAIRALIRGFHPKMPIEEERLLQEIGRILTLAERVGEPLHAKAQELGKGFSRYLKHPEKKELAQQFIKQALQLEQETREI